jgi:hypothetical protein
MHLHLEEQQKEIADCRDAHAGKSPMRLLLDSLCEVAPQSPTPAHADHTSLCNLTAVHCTHSDPEELSEFLANGGHVCVCPLTEAHLGVGVIRVACRWAVGYDCDMERGWRVAGRCGMVCECCWVFAHVHESENRCLLTRVRVRACACSGNPIYV